MQIEEKFSPSDYVSLSARLREVTILRGAQWNDGPKLSKLFCNSLVLI